MLIPSDSIISSYRSDIYNYLVDGQTLANYSNNALAQFKMDVKDKRGIAYTTLLNDDGDGYAADFADRILWMLSYLAISLVFRDNSIQQSNPTWWDLANEYESRYSDRLNSTDFSSLIYSRPQLSFVVERA